MKLTPIPNWRQALRMDTVQLALVLAFLSSLQADVLPMLRPIFPQEWWPLITGGIALCIVLLRLRLQPALHESAEEPKA